MEQHQPLRVQQANRIVAVVVVEHREVLTMQRCLAETAAAVCGKSVIALDEVN